MTNSLIACGGTGAHVALALLRLHTLGYPLGFFQQANGRPLDFPTLYLVDQDSGPGNQDETAWQMVRRLAEGHPGRHDPRETIAADGGPKLRVVTPLPVGADRDWFDAPNDSLRKRFGGSSYLDLLTDRDQRDIEFSRGMMGSPAVGALLFRLKNYDVSPRGVNHDDVFETLRKEPSRIAVVGSGVGGTGAAVAPSLARKMAPNGRGVMAVVLLQWFRFGTDGLDDTLREKAQLRNDTMRQNASSALAYCGQDLAREVAAVPVGVPETAIVDRRYTSDTQQPTCESFVHGVAALCCLRHFLQPYSSGLYQMGAADPQKFGGGNAIPGGTLQDLANQAATLADTLDAFATTLSASDTGGWLGGVVPAIHRAIGHNSVPRQTAQALRALTANYRKHLEWIVKVGVEPRPVTGLTIEAISRARLREHPILRNSTTSPDETAYSLFHWVADWIRDYRQTHPTGLVMRQAEVNGGYWPPLSGDDGISAPADRAGELTRVPDQNMEVTLAGFVQPEQVSENGWPNAIAVADHFRYAIQREDRTAKRQLEMLLAGLVSGDLKLRETGESDHTEKVSLDALVTECRDSDFPDLGRYAIVWPAEDDEVLGFNAPHTLLCATPPAEQRAARIWAALWEKLTGSEQPANWAVAAAPASWRHADRAVRQIRSWLGHLKKLHPETPPAWTYIFDDLATSEPVEYGSERRTFSVYWNSADQPLRIALPTGESGGYPPPDPPPISEEVLFDEVPDLKRLPADSGNMLFEMVEFETPNREGRLLRTLWKEHLEHLQKRGRIAGFDNNADDVFIWMQDRVRAAKLTRTRILDREVIRVRSCTPMRQDPVPGSSTQPGETRYPDLPLLSEYIGLVQTDTGETLLDLLKAGDTSVSGRFQPVADDDPRRGRSVTWALQMKGRRDPLTITLPVPPDEDPHRAHWMVWPRFRSSHRPFWRAYYVYEHCTDRRLRLDTLWLDPESERVQRCEAPEQSSSHAIRFEVGAHRKHTGGPPLAFSARNTVSREEIGLYLIPLTALSTSERDDIKVGIDFGTSHTVASVLTGDEPGIVELAPELDPANVANALTLHVSEHWSHVTAPLSELGLLALGVWLPTYVKSVAPTARGLLPSELLTTQPLAGLQADDIRNWEPGRDCAIPCMNVQRGDLTEFILADFKWDVSHRAFRGREAVLRELYLGMAIEIVMADVVWRRGVLPGGPVDFTFTYPLRTDKDERASFRTILDCAMENGQYSLGCTLQLRNNIGIYSESRAAKGGTNSFGEVSLVGDLGGGTLDLFMSANTLKGIMFEEVAESARLGGNLLLGALARQPERFLPTRSGWKTDNPEKLETQLRAWMRSKGSPDLFGEDAGDVEHKGLGLKGFAQPAEANPARQLIDRYFRLIAEYMARSVVAFIACHWYPMAPEAYRDRLRILVQLRGNGWRLWYDGARYQKIEEQIGSWIEKRASALWDDASLWSDSKPVQKLPESSWSANTGDANPKTAPILAAVGKAESPEDAERPFRHTLVQLQLLHAERSNLDPVPWFSRIPFKTDGRNTTVELRTIEPPLPLSNPEAGMWIKDLDDDSKKRIHEKLQQEGSFTNDIYFSAPVAPIVWEAVFKSPGFLTDD